MVCEHVQLCNQTEDGPKTASSGYGAESIIVISNTVSVFPFHVLTLYHESNFTFVKFAPLSLNFIVKAGAENGRCAKPFEIRNDSKLLAFQGFGFLSILCAWNCAWPDPGVWDQEWLWYSELDLVPSEC